jgi:microfibrillar-associated protein 1
MPPKRMTANPLKAPRYRPGKAVAEELSSSEEGSDEEDEEIQPELSEAPPKATSFPSSATSKITTDLKKVDLAARRKAAETAEATRIATEKARKAKEEEGFETESSEEEEASGSEEDSGSEEESSSEEEAPKKVLLRPTFIPKSKRNGASGAVNASTSEADQEKKAEEEAERKKHAANVMIQEQLEKDAIARAAGKKYWDDDEGGEVEELVDDTDGLDPEAEKAAWKLRELTRIKRERDAVEEAEKERDEVERRRNLSKDERDAEDASYIAAQREEKDGKGKMSYLQKYYHKGAFFQDDSAAAGLDQRDLMGARIQDDVQNRELLPEYLQIRDVTKLGKRGGTKYKDLKSEDTGRWGIGEDKRNGPGSYRGTDERFMSDRDRERLGGDGPSGSNAAPLGDRKKFDRAPDGPKSSSYRALSRDREWDRPSNNRPKDDGRSRRDYDDRGSRKRSYSRSRSPRREQDRHHRDERRDERKRSLSPYRDTHGGDKRQRVDSE